ncbi:hypothetical protein RvVAR0630_30480 [Agrobacterium vitis]|uniref:DUF7946 domain-containing protein n=1 Tax=Agrobacterium vitis TaxID=373 RepID=UPI0015D72FE6|nr:hypothetical protein [Agrobacterium vitis]BCH60424.1 hypothetical protein RvVAR0630_30480 [Agrobacterium vitis]
MPEKIQFHFEGRLADQHTLNFYEAARFQYATARLVVKLAQFRDLGRFSKRIHASSNFDVLLETHKEGSFDITILAPLVMAGYDAFVSTSLSTLMTYVFERIVGKSSDSEVAKSLNSVQKITDTFGQISENNTDQMKQVLEFVDKNQDHLIAMADKNAELYERLLAERERVNLLGANSLELHKIDPVREQKLISMSAPLVTEMATVLRTSADSLQVIARSNTSGKPRNILYLNKKMAEEIESDVVDQQMTSILGNIIQYNKESGWGKVRADFPNSPMSFNIPSDVKSTLQSKILAAMGREKIYMRTYVVRNKAKEATRLVVVGLMDMPVA